MAVEQLKNYGYALLAGAIDGSTDPVTFSVAAGTGARFPSSGNFRITIRSSSAVESDQGEILLVTSRSTDALTASRAQEGTTIAAHAIGDVCRHVNTAGGQRQLLADYQGFGTSASRPTAGFAGRRYKPTDFPVEYIDDGTHWLTQYKGVLLPYGPVTKASFTETNFQSGTSSTQIGDCVRIIAQGQGADSFQYLMKNLATPTSYTITAAIEIGNNFQRQFTYAFLGVKLQSAGDFIAWGIYDNGTDFKLNAGFYPAATGLFSKSIPSGYGFVFVRIAFSGTNIVLSYSFDGTMFIQVFTQTRATYFASNPDKVMLACDPDFTGDTYAARFDFMGFVEA